MKRVFVLFLLVPICAIAQTLEPLVVDSNLKKPAVEWIEFVNDSVGYLSLNDTTENFPYHTPPVVAMLYKTTDGGFSWNKIYEFQAQTRTAMSGIYRLKPYGQDSLLMIAYLYPHYGLYVSSASNFNFHRIRTDADELTVAGDTIYLTTGRQLDYSTDIGTTWNTIYSSTRPGHRSQVAYHRGYVYMAYDNYAPVGVTYTDHTTYIVRSADNGSTWDTVYNAPGGVIRSIYLHDDFGLAVGGGQMILSYDGGASWSKDPTYSNSNGVTYECGHVGGPRGLAIAATNSNYNFNGTNKVLLSTNFGLSWNTILTKTYTQEPEHYELTDYDVCATPDGDALIFLPNKQFYRYELPPVGINDPAYNITVNAYPNPGSTQVNIQWQQPLSGELRLYNLQGELLQQHQLHAQNDHILDISSLHSGMYLISIRSAQGTYSTRLVVE